MNELVSYDGLLYGFCYFIIFLIINCFLDLFFAFVNRIHISNFITIQCNLHSLLKRCDVNLYDFSKRVKVNYIVLLYIANGHIYPNEKILFKLLKYFTFDELYTITCRYL